MTRFENECVSCADAYPCVHCERERVRHLYCDECGDDVDKLYRFEGGEYCADCVLGKFDTIE